MIIKDRKLIAKYNGKKGGRPKVVSDIRIELPSIELVNLTQEQYLILLEKYGYELLSKSIEILENWLKFGGKSAEKYIGKNNYAHFRKDGWVVNLAKESF